MRKRILFSAIILSVITAACAARRFTLTREAQPSTAVEKTAKSPAAVSVSTAELETAETTLPEVSPSPDTSATPAAEQKIAYITIDDGPSDITPAVLDTLKKHEVRATFFVLPKANRDALYERIIAEGHILGNHTYSHDYKMLYGNDASLFRADVEKMRDWLIERFGYTATVFRFPGGSFGRPESVLTPRIEILKELGYKWYDWNTSFGDSAKDDSAQDPKALSGNALRINDKSSIIILMHDSSGKNASVLALETVITTLKERGYVFETLDNYK